MSPPNDAAGMLFLVVTGFRSCRIESCVQHGAVTWHRLACSLTSSTSFAHQLRKALEEDLSAFYQERKLDGLGCVAGLESVQQLQEVAVGIDLAGRG